jgi:cell division protein FtsL
MGIYGRFQLKLRNPHHWGTGVKMIAAIKKQIGQFILEILLIVVSATGTILWTQNSALATQQERVTGLEKQIEVLRQENRDDHKHILDLLRNK